MPPREKSVEDEAEAIMNDSSLEGDETLTAETELPEEESGFNEEGDPEEVNLGEDDDSVEEPVEEDSYEDQPESEGEAEGNEAG